MILVWSSRVGDVANGVVIGLASNMRVRAKRSPIYRRLKRNIP